MSRKKEILILRGVLDWNDIIDQILIRSIRKGLYVVPLDENTDRSLQQNLILKNVFHGNPQEGYRAFPEIRENLLRRERFRTD